MMVSPKQQIDSRSAQTGSATLVVALVLLIVTSMITLYAGRNVVMEQRISANDYRAKQLAQAADAGVEYGIAWLISNPNGVIWNGVADASGMEYSTNTIGTSLSAGYTIVVTLKRPLGNLARMQVYAKATETGGTVSAEGRTEILMSKLLAGYPDAALVLNGCLSNVNGNPDADNADVVGGTAVVSSKDASCIDTGHLNLHGDTVADNDFAGTAWDRTFSLSQTQVKAMANAEVAAGVPFADRTVHWITSASPWSTNIGNPSSSPPQSRIIVFTGCPKVNGGTILVGIVYFVGPCDSNGWGGGKVYGSVIMEGDMSKLNANTSFTYSRDYIDSLYNSNTGVQAKVPGGWIDKAS